MCVCTGMHVLGMFVCMYVCMYGYVCVRYVCMHVCVYVRVCAFDPEKPGNIPFMSRALKSLPHDK